SLWTERAIDYRQRRGITNEGIAVVVQRMVPAEVAGVMFTADPVTGARNEIVVEATAGLGDAVVAGRVTPHRVAWDKRAGRIRSSRPGTPLTREDLRRLAGLGRRLERHFGTPQDIEWAWYRGRPYLLQTRPITALPPPPPRQTYERVFASLVAEVLPIRPFPLDVTTWLGSVLSTAESVARDLGFGRSEEHTSELQSRENIVCRL